MRSDVATLIINGVLLIMSVAYNMYQQQLCNALYNRLKKMDNNYKIVTEYCLRCILKSSVEAENYEQANEVTKLLKDFEKEKEAKK